MGLQDMMRMIMEQFNTMKEDNLKNIEIMAEDNHKNNEIINKNTEMVKEDNIN